MKSFLGNFYTHLAYFFLVTLMAGLQFCKFGFNCRTTYNYNMCYFLVKSSLVKLETSRTVILCLMASALWQKGRFRQGPSFESSHQNFCSEFYFLFAEKYKMNKKRPVNDDLKSNSFTLNFTFEGPNSGLCLMR